MAQIRRDENHILVDGAIKADDCRSVSSALYEAIWRGGNTNIVLDFSRLTSAYAEGMLPLISLCLGYVQKGAKFDVRLPNTPVLRHLFINANWAFLLDPSGAAKSSYQVQRHVAAMRFYDAETQNEAVNSIVRTISSKVTGAAKDALTALQWSLDEITDNVISHSKSEFGGVVQATTVRQGQRVRVVVVDLWWTAE